MLIKQVMTLGDNCNYSLFEFSYHKELPLGV